VPFDPAKGKVTARPAQRQTDMPTWWGAEGRPVPTHVLSLRTRSLVMRHPVGHSASWDIGMRTSVINWCGHENGYVPLLLQSTAGWFCLMPVRV